MRTDGLREIAFTIRTVQKDGLRGSGLTGAHYDGLLEAVGNGVLPEAADEIDALRKALVEAGRCPHCEDGRNPEVVGNEHDGSPIVIPIPCEACSATGIRADLSPSTQAAVKAAREAIDG